MFLREWTLDAGPYGEFPCSDVVSISLCEGCGEPTILRATVCDDIGLPYGESVLYPLGQDMEALPARIRSRLEEAMRVRRASPNSYAVAIRRLVESICNDADAQGRDLYAKLIDLAKKGALPQALAEVGHQLRIFGKTGAHDLPDEVTQEDIPLLDFFRDALLDFYYRVPAMVTKAQARLKGNTLIAGQAAEHSEGGN